MFRQFAFSAGRAVALGFAAFVIVALRGSMAFAACALPSGTTPGSCSYSGTGAGLTVTDTGSGAGHGAIQGVAKSASGFAVKGAADKAGTTGGLFTSAAPISNSNNAAVSATNSGGSKTTEGNYGSAGIFDITNAENMSPAISVTTNGADSHGISVVNTAPSTGQNCTYYYSDIVFDCGGDAGFFEIDSQNSIPNQSAIFAVNNADNGAAGTFAVTGPNNTNAAIVAYDTNAPGLSATSWNNVAVSANSPNGSGIVATTGSTGNGFFGVQGINNGAGGGSAGVKGEMNAAGNQGAGVWGDSSWIGVYGTSNGGSAGYFNETSNSTHCYFNGGSNWSCTSDRNLKEDFRQVDAREVLRRLDAMPVFNYHMKHFHDPATRFMGPVAQDFRAAFGLGENDTHINTGDEIGVALAAAKGLYRKLMTDEATIAAQDAKIAALQGQLAEQKAALADRVARLEATVARLAQGATGTKQASLTEH